MKASVLLTSGPAFHPSCLWLGESRLSTNCSAPRRGFWVRSKPGFEAEQSHPLFAVTLSAPHKVH